MRLRHRLPLLFGSLVSILLAVVMLTVFYLFAKFRKEEFKDRLAQKAESTVRLLLQVKEVDEQMLKIIDRNTINHLYDEKTLIFNDSFRLIYSSIDDAVINWTPADLLALKTRHETFKQSRVYDVLGIYYPYMGKDYYVLISAKDTYGLSKLNFLKWLLLGAFLVGSVLVWFLSFYLSTRILAPLDRLRTQMQEVTTNNLKLRVLEPSRRDEIQALSRSFNDMLERIDNAYKGQRAFTANASHELRTPLARVLAQLENLMRQQTNDHTRQILQSIIEDTTQLADIVTSLFLLSRIEDGRETAHLQKMRLDEILFAASSQLSSTYPDFRLQFDIHAQDDQVPDMEVDGDQTMIKIALINVLKNAYMYSDDRTVHTELLQDQEAVSLLISNKGDTPAPEELQRIFETFSRGSNAQGLPGSGIGLSVVQRILAYHQATIHFSIPGEKTNLVTIRFPRRF